MGRQKMLLPWGDTTILGYLISQWQKLAPEQVVLVHGPGKDLVTELDRLNFPLTQRIENTAPERGMFSSIRCAANWDGWKKGLTSWAIVLGDQPHLRESTLNGLIDFARAHSEQICQPAWDGRPKHPVILPANIFAELKTTECLDLKAFLRTQAAELALFRCDDPGLEWDIDHPADYDRVRARFG
jgi:molybdenum cofactor cytidylyltransferase